MRLILLSVVAFFRRVRVCNESPGSLMDGNQHNLYPEADKALLVLSNVRGSIVDSDCTVDSDCQRKDWCR